MTITILLEGDAHRARGAHPENSPLRLCEVQYEQFDKHYREIRRFIWEDTDLSERSGGQAQASA